LPAEDGLRELFSGVRSLTLETVPKVGHHLHLEEPRLVADRIERAWQQTRG
jgi:pimeloyl-ACP methyl ester carboxylesterase